jgi:hypothetical protein
VIACVQNTVDDDDGKGETGSILLSSVSGLSAVVIILCVMMMLLAAPKFFQKYYAYYEIIFSYCCNVWLGQFDYFGPTLPYDTSLERAAFGLMVHG